MRWHPSRESDRLVIEVHEQLCRAIRKMNEKKGKGARGRGETRGPTEEVTRWLRKKEKGRKQWTRQSVLPLLWEGYHRGLLFLTPPRDDFLAQLLAKEHPFLAELQAQGKDRVQVIDVRDPPKEEDGDTPAQGHGTHIHPTAAANVAAAAADLVLELARSVRKANPEKERVSIGLGAGHASMLVAERLAQLATADIECPRLRLHALSSGLSDERPDHAPITFFSFFDDERVDVQFVGLFSEAYVRPGDYTEVRDLPGVADSFRLRDEIDIVVTSLGLWQDQGTLFRQFLASEPRMVKALDRAGCKGDVQFRPYSADGPIVEARDQVRVVTLFELSELAEFARKPGKYVVLLAGPCRQPGCTRADALKPLLNNPDLHLFTHLVTDLGTGLDLLSPAARASQDKSQATLSTNRKPPDEEPPGLVHAVLERFFEGLGRKYGARPSSSDSPRKGGRVKARGGPLPAGGTGPRSTVIAEETKWEVEQLGWHNLTKDRVFDLLYEGVIRADPTGAPVLLIPRKPREWQLAEKIASMASKSDIPDAVRVVPVRGSSATMRVAEAGAELVMSLLKRIRSTKRAGGRAHIGLGAGTTTRMLIRRLAQLAAADDDCPPLTLHALTAGFSVTDPGSAPSTFFRFFDKRRVDVESVGLFSEAVVYWKQYDRVLNHPSVSPAFGRKDEIDLVITSLAWKEDEDGLLNRFLEGDKGTQQRLEEQGWVGDVQYLPYSRKKPIELKQGIRAVTLFGLTELVNLARQRNKYVVLLCGPCGQCRKLRTEALRPLLQEEDLRVFSHLVLDMRTATALVGL